MALGRFEHTGNAPATGLAAGIAAGDLSCSLLSGTGYPTGAIGNFVLALDAGTAAEEKILCSARSGTSITIVTRGFDNTTAFSHSAGTMNVQHVMAAAEIDDASRHINDPSQIYDDHHQYARTDGTRTVTGLQTFAAGVTVAGTATVNGNETVSGTLGVTGAATLGSAAVTGNETVGGTLAVTGGLTAATVDPGITGATAAGRYVGTTAAGAPIAGTFLTGDWVTDQTGNIWICTTGGTPGTWAQVGGTTDTTWTAESSFTNSWVNLGAPYMAVGYRMVGGRVYLRGSMKSGTINAAAFTLPAAYRPSATLLFACNSNGAMGQLTVAASGAVTPSIGSNVSFSLDNVSFDTL